MFASIALLSSAKGALVPPSGARLHPLARVRVSNIHCSLFAEQDTRKQRLDRVAEIYGLDPEKDEIEIANRAASSLPDEENGDWGDVAMCTLGNAAVVGALLAAVGALPGQASAAIMPTILVSDEIEMLDVVAIFAVPWIVGGVLVYFLATNYEKFIDKINEGR